MKCPSISQIGHLPTAPTTTLAPLYHPLTVWSHPDHLHRFKALLCLYIPTGQGTLGCYQCELSGQAVLSFVLVFVLLSPSILDHGSKIGISRQVQLRFCKLRAFWNTKDHLVRIRKVALCLQIVLVVYTATS